MANPFTNWGMKSEEPSGVTVERGKRERKLRTKRDPSAVISTTKAYSYDKRVKPKEERVDYLPKSTRHTPKVIPATYGGETGIEFKKEKATSPIEYGERHKPIVKKPVTFGGKTGIEFDTVAAQEKRQKEEEHRQREIEARIQNLRLKQQKKDAEDLVKAEKKRVKEIEQEFKKAEKEKKAKQKLSKKRAKMWNKSYKFNRKSPLASKLRKIF